MWWPVSSWPRSGFPDRVLRHQPHFSPRLTDERPLCQQSGMRVDIALAPAAIEMLYNNVSNTLEDSLTGPVHRHPKYARLAGLQRTVLAVGDCDSESLREIETKEVVLEPWA